MEDKIISSPVVMATSAVSVTVEATAPKKETTDKSKKSRTTPSHPKTSDMVNSAITALKERGGTSVQAIKKYMVGTYKIDAEQQATFIKKYLKAAVASGTLVQTKGKGATGSFKFSSTKVDAMKPKDKPTTRAVASKKAAASKKPVAVKKSASFATKKVAAKGADTAAKEKKNKVKGPAAKPPKAKTTKAKPASNKPAQTKPVAMKKSKPDAAKPKTAAPKKTIVSPK